MKVLFDNKLLDATATADNASENYPVTNLQHEFLKKRYQSIALTYDTVKFTFDTATDIDCIFFAYSNAGQIDVRLYDASDVLLADDTWTGVDDITARSKFYSTTYSVKYIEIDVYGGVGGYLGGVAAGECVNLGYITSPWAEPYQDNSFTDGSPAGQQLQNKIRPLRNYTWVVRDLTRTEANTQRALYEEYGIGALVWVDVTYDNHDFIAPFYAIISDTIRTTKNGIRYDIEWSFREAR